MKQLYPGQASLWTVSLIDVLTVFSWAFSVSAVHDPVTEFAQVLHLDGPENRALCHTTSPKILNTT